MGRELRRVPANWVHPKKDKYNYSTGSTERIYQPLFDETSEDAFTEWQKEYRQWRDGEHDRTIEEYGEDQYPKELPYYSFCSWHGSPPDPEYYRPAWKEATWWQVYETVSEGTPVSPPFETQQELFDYLVANGDYWDQNRRKKGNTMMDCDPWTREQAAGFVFGAGWVPSLVISNGVVKSGIETLSSESKNH